MTDAIQQFWKLVDTASEADSRPDSSGCPTLEPFCRQMIVLIHNNPNMRESFAEAIWELYEKPERGPWEIVSYLIHSLRWYELKPRFLESHADAIKTSNWRAEPVARYVLEAFEDEWADSILWDYFRNENNGMGPNQGADRTGASLRDSPAGQP
jgi:hypothetical protein